MSAPQASYSGARTILPTRPNGVARMIGAAAEIDDHLNRGRNMDTRTPLEQCAFVV
jgi:hypothetical protein